jgi:tetratricopeptide (TPR) repeat protein
MEKEINLLFASEASRLAEENKINEALKVCESGVREFPFYVPGHYILGLCYDKLGQLNDAKNEFERVLIFDPSHKTAMRRLSDIYDSSGLDKLANDMLIREAVYSPVDTEIINILKQKALYQSLTPLTDFSSYSNYEDESEMDGGNEMEIEKETQPHSSEDDSGFGNIDPLAADLKKTAEPDEEESFTDTDEYDEGYGLAGKNYLNSEDEDAGYDDWMEVENLLGDEQYSEPKRETGDPFINVVPPSEMLKNDTELLLEELRNAEAQADMETSISDEYENAKFELETDENADIEDSVNNESNSFMSGEESSYMNEVIMEENEEIAHNVKENENHFNNEKYQTPEKTSSEEPPDEESEMEEEVTIQDLMHNPNLVTPTFGEILIAQHKFNEARHVFMELSKKEPANPRFKKKIIFLDKFLQAQNLS